MKLKNFLSIAAFIICGLVCVNSVKADAPAAGTTNTDKVTVNIIFKPIQTIQVNSGQKTVDLVYQSKENYNEGVSSEQADHLTVFSTGGFTVNVKSDGNFKRGDGANVIPAGDVKIIATEGTKKGVATFTPQALTEGDTPIISSSKGGRDLTYNIKYDNTADGFGDKAQVTYTIVSK